MNWQQQMKMLTIPEQQSSDFLSTQTFFREEPSFNLYLKTAVQRIPKLAYSKEDRWHIENEDSQVGIVSYQRENQLKRLREHDATVSI